MRIELCVEASAEPIEVCLCDSVPRAGDLVTTNDGKTETTFAVLKVIYQQSDDICIRQKWLGRAKLIVHVLATRELCEPSTT